MKKSRRTYTRELKLKALRLLEKSDKSAAQIERDLDISAGCLSRWKRELAAKGEEAFPGQGRLTPDQERVQQLERENEVLCQEKGEIEKQKPSRAVLTTTTIMAVIMAIIAMLADVTGGLAPTRTDPGETEEYYQQGLSYERKEDYENAIASYQKAIEINPENAAAHNALAWLYAELETNLDDAIDLAQKAVALTQGKEHPSRDYWLANYLDTLGWAYYKSGNYTEAVAALERAVALNDRRSFSVHLEAARTALNSSQDVEP